MYAFHDDDLLHPQYLEFALNALNTYPNVSLITTRYTEFFDGNPPKHINNIESRHYFYENGRNFAKMMYFCEIIAYAPAIYRTKDFLATPLEYEKYSKFNDWPFMVKIAQKGASVLFDDQSMFLVRRHNGQDTWTHTNVPTIEQIVNWDLCFRDAIKPKFLTKEWLCFMTFAKLFFTGKYHSFVPIEMRSKKLRAELVKCARNNGVYPVIFKIINTIFPKIIIDKMCKVERRRIRKLFFVK